MTNFTCLKTIAFTNAFTNFSSAYPLAGLCAILNNLIEIRSDAFKLCFIHQRPFAQRVASIGCWQTAMELMGVAGVVVNCALIGLSGKQTNVAFIPKIPLKE